MSAAHTPPLFDPAAAPDGWHDVRSPGGYEWWYFDAESGDGRVQLVAIFLQGFIFHPGYLRRYGRYLRRPTRVAPPMPGDATCAYLAVYRDGRVWKQFLTQYPGVALSAAKTGPLVRLGPNSVEPQGEDLALALAGTPWHLTARGPQLSQREELSAALTFSPALTRRPMARRFLSRRMTAADHFWVLADPRNVVSGQVSCGSEQFSFEGVGYHDHNYGTAPIGPGLKRWIWGRAFDDAGVTTFHFARPADPDLPDEVHLVEADADAIQEVEAPAKLDWSRKSKTLLRYPNQIEFGDRLRLRNPKVVEDSPFYLRLTYEATTRRGPGRAFCEVAYPHRLRWPILGRMIEMSLDKRPLKEARRAGSPA